MSSAGAAVIDDDDDDDEDEDDKTVEKLLLTRITREKVRLTQAISLCPLTLPCVIQFLCGLGGQRSPVIPFVCCIHCSFQAKTTDAGLKGVQVENGEGYEFVLGSFSLLYQLHLI